MVQVYHRQSVHDGMLLMAPGVRAVVLAVAVNPLVRLETVGREAEARQLPFHRVALRLQLLGLLRPASLS